jgi:HlyD family secretion protein
MEVDLEDLRIERNEEAPSGRGASRIWMYLFFLALVLGAAAVAYLLEFGHPDRTIAVQVERVPGAAGPVRSGSTGGSAAFSAAGWLKLPRYHPVHVTPLVEGRLEDIHVIEGDKVKKGQVIARLYDADLKAEYQAAEAAVRAAAAEAEKRKTGYRPQELAEARAEVKGLEAELLTAREICEHSRKLRPSGAIPLEELQRDEMRVKTLEASLGKAKQRLSLLEEGFRKEDIALAAAKLEKARAERDLKKLRLSYTEIKSPMDGVVLTRLAVRGQWIRPAEGAIVSLYDPTDLEARVDVNQDDIAKVFLGQRVEVSTRAEPGKILPGKVVLLEPQADLVKNTVPVRVKILDPKDRLLHPDMVVKARFLVKTDPGEKAPSGTSGESAAPAITVPVIAVVSEGDDHYVYVVGGGAARRRKVALGKLEDGRYAVNRGLRGGDQVVVSGVEALTDGAAVRVVK